MTIQDEQKKLNEEIFEIGQELRKYEIIISKLRNLFWDKKKQLIELNKIQFFESLELFGSSLNYKLIDYNESNKNDGGCYFLYENDEIIYIGVSINIRKRLIQHKGDRKKWDFVKYIPCTDYLEAIKIESYYINKFKPKLNIQLGAYAHIAEKHEFKVEDSLINYPSGWPDKTTGETNRSKRKEHIYKRFW